MGATSAPASAAAAAAGGVRTARAPLRVLAAAAITTAVATALLFLGAGHTELRLSAGLQLSIGRLSAAAVTSLPSGSPAVHKHNAPPLPPGQLPDDANLEGRDAELEQYAAYGSAYEQVDVATLAGGEGASTTPVGSSGGSGSTKPSDSGIGKPVAGGGGAQNQAGKGKPAVAAASAAARASGAACSEALYVKKVALLFLTTKRLAHEKLWRLWMWDAAGLLPQQALPTVQEALCGPADSAASSWQRIHTACSGTAAALSSALNGSAAMLLPPQHLFSIYVHAPPTYKGLEYQPLFQGRVIPARIKSWWGGAGIMEAERALLSEALKSPQNERFILISESDIPLYDPLTFYQQLLHEGRSKVKACKAGHMNIDRWQDGMANAKLRKEHWRKSNQFFSLTRKHAEAVMADTAVFSAFKNKCGGWYAREKRWKECVPDEHYLPTLLASLGLEGETYCGGWGVAWTDWSANDIHPRSYMPKDVTPALFKKMRWGCKNAKEAGQDAGKLFLSVPELLAAGGAQQACRHLRTAAGNSSATSPGYSLNSSSSSSNDGSNSSSSSSSSGEDGNGNGAHLAAGGYIHPLDGACPLTARKFPPYTALRVRQLFLTSCPGTGMQVKSKAAQAFSSARDPDVNLLRGTACAAVVQQMSMQQLGAKRRRLKRRKRHF